MCPDWLKDMPILCQCQRFGFWGCFETKEYPNRRILMAGSLMNSNELDMEFGSFLGIAITIFVENIF